VAGPPAPGNPAPVFEILEHPADIGFRVRAATLAALFENAALAMLSIAGEIKHVEPRQTFALSATAADLEALLVNWLNEVLWWSDGKQIAFREFRVQQIDEGGDAMRVAAIGAGEPRDPARHRAKLIIKAVTYHQLKVVEALEGWVAEVFLDF
jgi:SHS2 domain-containing protein